MTVTEHDTSRLDEVLHDLAARGVLTADQAAEVRAGFAVGAAAPGAAQAGAPVRRPGGARAWVVEVAAYLGAVLVAASLLVIAAQRWSDWTYAQHLALLLTLGTACVVMGLLVVRATPGRRVGLRDPVRAARCRVVSVLLALGAVLFAGALAVAVRGESWDAFAASTLALALLVAAAYVAPSVITDVAMFAATLAVVGNAVATFVPFTENRGGDFPNGPPPAQFRDYALPTALVLTGLLWAVVVAPRLVVPKLGIVLGLLVAFETAMPAAGNEPTRWWGLTLLAALAVVGLVGFVRDRFWAWLVASVLSVTAFVFILVGQSAGPAIAFLVAGVVLLGGAAVGSRLGRRPPDAARGARLTRVR